MAGPRPVSATVFCEEFVSFEFVNGKWRMLTFAAPPQNRAWRVMKVTVPDEFTKGVIVPELEGGEGS